MLLSALLNIKVPFQILVDLLLLVDGSFVVVNFVTLRDSLLSPFLVLQMDVLLDHLDV